MWSEGREEKEREGWEGIEEQWRYGWGKEREEVTPTLAHVPLVTVNSATPLANCWPVQTDTPS